jgi:hypothetical protein
MYLCNQHFYKNLECNFGSLTKAGYGKFFRDLWDWKLIKLGLKPMKKMIKKLK